MAGIFCGVLFGGFWPAGGLGIKFIGELFIRALLMLVVPLIMASMTVGISRLGDIRRVGGIGSKTIIYYMTTTALSVIVGITLVNLVQPGSADTEKERIALRGGELMADTPYRIEGQTIILNTPGLRRIYDERYMVILSDQENIRGVVEQITGTDLPRITVKQWENASGEQIQPNATGKSLRIDLTIVEKVKGKPRSVGVVLRNVVVGLIPSNLFKAMANNEVLPLIIFSLLLGGVLTTLGKTGKPVIKVFVGLNDAIMKIVQLLMLTAPIGIGALIAGRLGDAGGFSGFGPEFIRLGKYAGTVIVGLLIHGMLVLPLILRFFGQQNVRRYTLNTAPALTTAFSTASSAATIPMTMQCVTEGSGVSKRTASFVLPLGATINMDGTALYEAVAAIFIAQIYGIDLTSVQMVVIFLTATLAAIGAAGIPEAGLVTMVIVLQAVNLPIEGISLILVIDWFLDRCRTTVNVWGDAVGAAVVDTLENKQLVTALE